MGLHPKFPESPYVILEPDIRWFPSNEEHFSRTRDKFIPPLVAQLRREVKIFRDSGYADASATSRSLLNWWFNESHVFFHAHDEIPFQYYFAQREALETIIYLYDVVRVKDPHDLIRFDSSGYVSKNMFNECWRRFVIKMATGTGKTKVMSLVLAWSFFHKLYEEESKLSRNFLVITPNIIVLDRMYKDLQGLSIFFNDPVIPFNGFDGRNWRDDFQLSLHLQDEVHVTQTVGNIFLTNIHRIYLENDHPPSSSDENTMDYFLGRKPSGVTCNGSLGVSEIVRDMDELMIINDEAHHIHDAQLAWFKSIEDIRNHLKHQGSELSLQLDVTATPKHESGAVFVQTIVDYPLIEAIAQNVVKHPVLPDAESRRKLIERHSVNYTEKFFDHLELGVIEWRKAYKEHKKLGKKAILFIMTDDTKNCDDVADYLEHRYSDLAGAVLVIHTKKNGEISESSTGKAKDELEKLRKQAHDIDSLDNPYKAIVSVLMLKEGWDVRNVTTIVGLRAYSSKSNILPEQTLGRGLRKMYPDNGKEYLSIVGTDAFMEFIESIEQEGLILERSAMGKETPPKAPFLIEIDHDNNTKDMNTLDISIPILTPRFRRDYRRLSELDVGGLEFQPMDYQQFDEHDEREIVFRDITTGEITHVTVLDADHATDCRGVLRYFAKTIMKQLHLVSDYDVLYGKLKQFIQYQLFGKTVDMDSTITLRNLSEQPVTKTVIETFKQAVNRLLLQPEEQVELCDTMRLQDMRPFIVQDQESLTPKKSIFKRIVGDSNFELQFAAFLETCSDVVSYAKNYYAIKFKLDYINAESDIVHYYPDFLVKLKDERIIVVETKGQEDVNVPLKMERLSQWCQDVNAVQKKAFYDFAYVDQQGFERYKPTSFAELLASFRRFHD